MGKSSLYHGCLCSAIVIDITLPLDPHLFNLGQVGQALPPPVPQPQSGPISNPVQDSLTYKDPVCKNGYREHSPRGTLRCYHRLSPPSLLTRPRGGGGLWRFPQPTRVCVGRGPHQAFSLASPPSPPLPPLHPPPHPSIHGAAHLLQCLASSGPARPCLAHAAHIYTIRTPPRLPACLSHPDPPSILLQPRHTSSWRLPCPSCCRIQLLDYAIPHPSSSHDPPGLVLLFWFLLTRISYI